MKSKYVPVSLFLQHIESNVFGFVKLVAKPRPVHTAILNKACIAVHLPPHQDSFLYPYGIFNLPYTLYLNSLSFLMLVNIKSCLIGL